MADIFGTPTDDQLIGTNSNDQIQGMEGHDTISGDAGDDMLVGGIGNDMYVFNPGDGNDVVDEIFSGGYDTIKMTGGIYPDEVTLISNGYDLIIQSGTGNQITVIGHFDPVMPQSGIERILFSDGTIWDRAAIETRIATNNQNTVTPGNDVIVGTPGFDVIDGGEGNDTISGTNGDDTLIGGGGNDVLIGGPGYDTLMGGDGNDVLRGMANSDQLNGGMGNDTYIVGYGSGQDQITDEGGNDTLYLGSPNTPGVFQPELTQLMRNATDLIVDADGSQITIRNYFDPFNPQNINQQLPIERIVFEDGTIWETEQILTRLNNGNRNYTGYSDDVVIGGQGNDYIPGMEGNDTISGGAGDDQLVGYWGNDRLFGNTGNDHLFGDDGNDILSGNAGDDILDGGLGNDTYFFNRGDGHDVVYEWNWGETNRVVFGDGISIQDLQFSQQGMDLVITLFGGGDSLRLTNTTMDPYGPKGVSLLEFADGMVLDLNNMQGTIIGTQFGDYLPGTPGNDTIYALGGSDNIQGNDGNDIIIGGSGMDSIEGGAGSDTYIYNLGDGMDRIVATQEYINPIYQPIPVNGIDILRLGEGIDPSIVILEPLGWDLSIKFLGSPSDEIIVQEYFNPQRLDSALDQIVFADGTVWNAEAIMNRAIQLGNNYPTPQADTLAGTSLGEFISGMEGNDTISGGMGNDQVYGDQGNDRLFGNAGNDTLSGGFGNDVLDGGIGNDFLAGDMGSDTYQFNAGEGVDEVIDDDRMSFGSEGNRDVIRLGDGYDAALVQLQRMGDDLVISMPGSSDQITVRNHFMVDYNDGSTHNAIESIVFADGTVWDNQAIINRMEPYVWPYSTGMTVTGSIANDVLYGSVGNDTISGGAGDDQLMGGMGNDRLFGNGGNDLLQGDMGNDTYYFNQGDGQDTITEWNPGENNRVVFGEGIGVENLELFQNGADVIIAIAGSMDSLRLTNTNLYSNLPAVIDRFEFADGSTVTFNQLLNIVRGSPADDFLADSPGDSVITGLAGNDFINAYSGNNNILGGAGNDNITGGVGNDLISGGSGNDTVIGSMGNDTYVFNRGDGTDRVAREFPYGRDPRAVQELDILRLGEGISPASVWLQQEGDNLRVQFPGNWGDEIVVEGYFDPTQSGSRIDQIVFADGTIWNNEAIDNYILQNNPGWPPASGITRTGTGIADVIHAGDGNDTISGDSGNDELVGHAGNDVLFGNQGSDMLFGGSGNDVLAGNVGDDSLNGGTGNDTYLYNLGDGKDWITPFSPYEPWPLPDTVVGIDTLQFGEGIDPASILFSQSGLDLIISIQNNSGDELTVMNYFMAELPDSPLDQIRFADGTVWNAEAITNRINQNNNNWPSPMGDTIADMGGINYFSGGDGNDTISGGAGDDQIMGDAGNDRMFGNAGNDQIDGGTGNDTYYYNLGDGHDVFSDQTPGETNRVVFGPGISVQNLRVTQAGLDIRIDIIGTEDSYNMGDSRDSLWLVNTTFDPNGPRAVSEFEFADGLVLNLEQLQNIIVGTNENWMPDYLSGTPANDTIVALGGSDTLAGGTGNDMLIGGSGPDVYVFNLGDGQDVVIDSEPASEFYMGMDSVEFGPGITQDIMSPGRMGNDLVIDFTSGDSLTIRNWYTSADNQVENLFFADGSMLSAAQLQAWADNLSPQVTQHIEAQQTGEDQPFNFTVPYGTFVDPNNSDQLTYSATLADNTPLPAWLNFDSYTGSFNGQPGNGDVGNLSIRVTATDPYGMTASTDFALTVNNVNDAPVVGSIITTQNAVEDQPFSMVVDANAFSDVDSIHGDTLTYSVTGAGGSPLPGWLSFDPVTRTLSGTPGNADVVNMLPLVVIATDTSGVSASQQFNINVSNTNDAPTLAIPLADANAAEGSAFSYTVPTDTFADVDAGDSLTYTATLADGTVLPGWLGFDAATRTFSGTPVNGNAGVINVRVTATDQAGVGISDDFAINVADTMANIIVGNSSNNTLYGTATYDAIYGQGGTDTLYGYAGNDSLDGGTGYDTMYGGTGDDIYTVNASGDKVIENANEGTDGVLSSVSHTLANNVENLVLTGTSNISATGNALDNIIGGNSGNNTLTGNAGNDVLSGGAGTDSLRGGTGNDTYVFARGDGVDTIRESDTTAGNSDTIYFNNLNPLDLVFTQSGSNLRVSLHGSSDAITVSSWYSGSQYQTEVLTTSDGYTLQSSQVNQLIQAMASFSSSSGLSWDQAIDQNPEQVQNIITAYWQPAP